VCVCLRVCARLRACARGGLCACALAAVRVRDSKQARDAPVRYLDSAAKNGTIL
jgi:hypothetical protein